MFYCIVVAVCPRHTVWLILSTPHCVYRLSVGLIEYCAFSTGLNILGDSEGVQIAALTICVPEARHPINPTLSDYGERSVG